MVEWSSSGPRVERVVDGLDDAAICELASGCAKVGIDAPLGWPEPFRQAIADHAAGEPWPLAGIDPDAERRSLRLRSTDIEIARATGVTPLSVSTDRLGIVALRAATLCVRLASESGIEVDRSGVRGGVAEVYPAGALAVWGLRPAGSYARGGGGEARRLAIAVGLGRRFGSGLEPALDSAARHSAAHRLDAVICALLAGLVLRGETAPPPRELTALAAIEGWIHVPRTLLGGREAGR